jgi:hypothetical protein
MNYRSGVFCLCCACGKSVVLVSHNHRYNMFRPGEAVRSFDLDSVGTDLPPDLLKTLARAVRQLPVWSVQRGSL